MVESRNTYKILCGNSQGRRSLLDVAVDQRIYLKGIEWEVVDWIYLAQDSIQ
jgi:hypothetical protein